MSVDIYGYTPSIGVRNWNQANFGKKNTTVIFLSHVKTWAKNESLPFGAIGDGRTEMHQFPESNCGP